MSWAISLTATAIALLSVYLYGNKSRKAPVVALLSYSIWICYCIVYTDFPILVPTVLNVILHTRNLIKMRKVT